MENKEYIDSGILELYVYGLLNETENIEIAELSRKNEEVNKEVIAIEKSIINLSSSFSPLLSSGNFEKIKSKLDLGSSKVIPMKTGSKSNYIGWVAAAVFLVGMGILYNQQNTLKGNLQNIENEKTKLNQVVVTTEKEKQDAHTIINVLKDSDNTVVTLEGQKVSPTSSAKIYWNKATQTVYVDASKLPEPPEGKVYQIWSLKLKPSLTPTSIGLLNDFKKNDTHIFKVEKTADAEAFGITLEPAGGSKSPTMEQLYTLGAV